MENDAAILMPFLGFLAEGGGLKAIGNILLYCHTDAGDCVAIRESNFKIAIRRKLVSRSY